MTLVLSRELATTMERPVSHFTYQSKRYVLFRRCHTKVEARQLVNNIQKTGRYSAIFVHKEFPWPNWSVGIRRKK